MERYQLRFFLAQCEYKWSHAHKSMEDLWVRRELGEELAKHVATKGYDLVLIRSKSQTMPEDIYCRCDIYIDIPDDKQATLFALKYNKALPLKRGQRDNEYW